MIQWLVGKEEGKNTFWGVTVFPSLKVANQHKDCVYREYRGRVEVLLGKEEGPNTQWNDFDPSFESVEDLIKYYPPADDRAVLRVKPKK